MMLRTALRVAYLLAVGLTVASPAYAYLDPSTASMVVSALVGIVAAIALALKMFWYRVVGLLRGAGGRPRRPAVTDEA